MKLRFLFITGFIVFVSIGFLLPTNSNYSITQNQDITQPFVNSKINSEFISDSFSKSPVSSMREKDGLFDFQLDATKIPNNQRRVVLNDSVRHPELENLIEPDQGTFIEVEFSDVNSDGITDIIAVNSFFKVVFIDGSNGEHIGTYEKTDFLANSITISNITLDDSPEIIVGGTNGVDSEIIVLDGTDLTVIREDYFFNRELIDLFGGTFGTNFNDDYAAFYSDGTLVFYEGENGNELFGETGLNYGETFVTDYNNDGYDDIAIASFGFDIVIVEGFGGTILNSYTSPTIIFDVYGVDVTSDDEAELIYAEYDTLVVHDMVLDSTVYNITFPSTNPGISRIASAEVTGDLIPDLIVGMVNGSIILVDGQDGSILAKNDGNGAIILGIELIDYSDELTTDFVISTGASEVLILSGVDLTRLDDQLIDDGFIVDLSIDDFSGDGIDDIVIIDDGSPSVVSFIYTDTTSPIVNFFDLPQVRTTDAELVFTLLFNDPKIDTVSFNYIELGTTESFFVHNPSTERLDFSFFFDDIILQFWFELNDTRGQITSVGSFSDPYRIDMFKTDVWNREIDVSRIIDFRPIKLTDSGTDIVTLSQNGRINFINGTTGDKLYDNEAILSTAFLYIDMVTADFTGDGIEDLAVAISETTDTLLFVDGQDGQTLAELSLTADVRGMTVGEFSGGGAIDLAISILDGIVVYDGSTQSEIGSFNSNDIGNGVAFNSINFNDDSLDDFVIMGENRNLLVFDGSTQAELLNFDTSSVDDDIVDYDQLKIDDITGDDVDDIIGKTSGFLTNSQLYVIDGSTQNLLFAFETSTEISDFKSEDFNNDGIQELLLITEGLFNEVPEVYILSNDGAIIFSQSLEAEEFGDDYLGGRIEAFDVSLDGIPDFIVQLTSGIFVIDGLTGQILETLTNDFQESVGIFGQTAKLISEDLDENGLNEMVYFQQNSLVAKQSIHKIKAIRPEISMQQSIDQIGGQRSINITLFDAFDNIINDATVTVVIAKDGGDRTATLASILNQNDDYQAFLSPESYDIGGWNVLPVIDHPIYQNIRLFDYINPQGELIDIYNFGIVGTLQPKYILDSADAPFNEQSGRLSNVIEGNQILMRIELRDFYAHIVGNDLVNISIQFADKSYTPEFPNEPHIMQIQLDTEGLRYGEYPVRIVLQGDYIVDSDSEPLTITIIPSQPTLGFGMIIILGIALLSFLFFSFVLKEQNDIYSSLGTNPEEVYSSIRRAIFAMVILLAVFTVIGLVTSSLTPLVSFIFLLAALLVILIIVLMWHFRITLKQYYGLQFRFRSIFLTLFLSIIVGVILAGIIIFGSQVEWIEYQMSLNTFTVPLINETIPQIIWEIAVTGFLSGFLYILLLDSYDTYSDIKELLEIEKKVLDGYYPKEPSKLYDSITLEAKKTFIGLSKGFLLWYGIILWSVINNLQLFGIVSSPLIAFVLPFLLASILFFRNQILAILGLKES